MRVLFPIAAAATLLSCSYPPPPPGAALAEETAGRIAGPPQSCVDTTAHEGLRALDEQTLAYSYGRTTYINHLPGPCPGIGPTSTLIVVPSFGGRYCRNDRVRGNEMGSMIPGPSCALGDWVPYRRP